MKVKEFVFYFRIVAIVIISVISIFPQKKSVRKTYSNPVLPCNLKISDSPKLRGFYLGQTSEEISERVLGFEREYQNADGGYYGEENINFKIVHLSSIDEFTDKLGELDDVTITWQFYNDKLVRLFVNYTEFVPKNLTDFMVQATEKTNLPLKSFKITDKHKAFLKCDEFTVELLEGQYSRVGWSPEYSQIIVEDTVSFAKMDKTVENIKKQRKDEEIRRKNEEIRKRRILKP